MTTRWNISPTREEFALLMEAGFIYRDAGRYNEARDVFEGVRAMLPSSEVPIIALGTVSFHEGKFEDARRSYQRAIELNPRSAYAYAHLGEALLFAKDKEAAREKLKKAIALDPRGEFGKMARSLTEMAEKARFRD